jgi:hypothetical protein
MRENLEFLTVTNREFDVPLPFGSQIQKTNTSPIVNKDYFMVVAVLHRSYVDNQEIADLNVLFLVKFWLFGFGERDHGDFTRISNDDRSIINFAHIHFDRSSRLIFVFDFKLSSLVLACDAILGQPRENLVSEARTLLRVARRRRVHTWVPLIIGQISDKLGIF